MEINLEMEGYRKLILNWRVNGNYNDSLLGLKRLHIH